MQPTDTGAPAPSLLPHLPHRRPLPLAVLPLPVARHRLHRRGRAAHALLEGVRRGDRSAEHALLLRGARRPCAGGRPHSPLSPLYLPSISPPSLLYLPCIIDPYLTRMDRRRPTSSSARTSTTRRSASGCTNSSSTGCRSVPHGTSACWLWGGRCPWTDGSNRLLACDGLRRTRPPTQRRATWGRPPRRRYSTSR